MACMEHPSNTLQRALRRTGDDGDDGRVCDAQAAHAVHAQGRVHNGVPGRRIGAHRAAAHIRVAAVHRVADVRVDRLIRGRLRRRVP